MEYQIAVCDDCEADRAYLSELAARWAARRGDAVRLSSFVSAENFLFCYAEKSDYDILLLDVEMGEMDGVTLAKRLRREDEEIQIVFVTGYTDYIAEGYEVAALHYLLKPVREEKFFAVLDRAAEKCKKAEKVLFFEASGETVRVPAGQIRYAEVFGNYVTIHARTDVTVKMTLGELERELDDRFFRVSRSAIVNLSMIARVTKAEIRLSDGSSVPLPRGAYEQVNRAIMRMR